MRILRLFGVALALVMLLPDRPGAAPVHWGPRVGFNASAFGGDYGALIEPDLRYLPNLGGALQVDLSRHLALRGELAYSEKGGRLDSDLYVNGTFVGTFHATWSFRYVEVPLFVRARLLPDRGVSPYLEGGASFGFTLGGDAETSGFDPPVRTDYAGRMRPVDIGWSAGAGAEVRTGRSRVGLEARYTRGFGSLFDREAALPAINQAWTFAASWLR